MQKQKKDTWDTKHIQREGKWSERNSYSHKMASEWCEMTPERLQMTHFSLGLCLFLSNVPTHWPVLVHVHGRVQNSLLQNWKLTFGCAQANTPIWLAWQGRHDTPMKRRGNNLEEKSMATANTSVARSRDKDAFCPIKYLHSGVFPPRSLKYSSPSCIKQLYYKFISRTRRTQMEKQDIEQNMVRLRNKISGLCLCRGCTHSAFRVIMHISTD